MNREEVFSYICRGNESAAEFLRLVTDVAHVWDDLIDRDVDVDPETIDRALLTSLVFLPNNEFYRQNFNLLHPVLLAAVNNWRVANDLEAGGMEDDLRIAFITRSSYIDLALQTAFIVGGFDWARTVGPTLRRFVHAEGWEAYQSNLNAEKVARERRTHGG